MHNRSIGCPYRQNRKLHAPCPILTMSINRGWTECQWVWYCVVGNLSGTQSQTAINQVFCSVYGQISKRCSPDCLPNNDNLIHFQCWNSVFLSVLANITGQHFTYRLTWPHHALFTHDARPKIIHAPLMLIFKIELGVCRFLFCL